MAFVYLITNNVNGKRYVGKTERTLEIRWQCHIGGARREDSDMLICRAIKKYGFDAFTKQIIEECDVAEVGVRETYWINELQTHVSVGGYNLTYGGDGGLLGYKHSVESREKMRQKAIGRKHSIEVIARIAEKKRGKKQSPESVKKRADANRGKKRTKQQKENIKNGLLNSGYKHSDETKKKISKKSAGRITSDDTKEKLRLKSTGKKHTTSAKNKISLATSRPISLYIDGHFIETYPLIKIASQKTNIPAISISRSLAQHRTIKGNTWHDAVIDN